jgi:hypothetical protein
MLSYLRLSFTILAVLALTGARPAAEEKAAKKAITATNISFNKYSEWSLGSKGISAELFSYALKGYTALCQKQLVKKTDVITLIDFSKPSFVDRLFVLNIHTGEVVFKTLVAHGRNSGKEYARSFSNKASSYQSSLGFYITTDTYQGRHGYSLRLKGCEKGINDNADARAIVIHGADYVSEDFIRQNGFLGRSHGCPALPQEVSTALIDIIKGGSCMFIYASEKKYLRQSALLKS